ncbi:MAG: HD domain-containing protein [Prevotella sp.]
MRWQQIIDKYYDSNPKLKAILVSHSKSVADKAVKLALAHKELPIDIDFLYEAAMLHDIGIVKTNAPGIECHGDKPYICHGIIGATMLRAEGLHRHARVCERHTGAGLSCAEIVRQNLPLPHADYLPETLEEQLICYADKFFSKTHTDREKTPEQAEHSVAKHGTEGLVRFKKWEILFGI